MGNIILYFLSVKEPIDRHQLIGEGQRSYTKYQSSWGFPWETSSFSSFQSRSPQIGISYFIFSQSRESQVGISKCQRCQGSPRKQHPLVPFSQGTCRCTFSLLVTGVIDGHQKILEQVPIGNTSFSSFRQGTHRWALLIHCAFALVPNPNPSTFR